MTSPLWKPFDRNNIANPYPMYRALRENDPVHFSQTGEWIITRYDDVRNILKSNKFLVGNRLNWLKKGITYFNNKEFDFQAIREAMDGFILFLNPPDHTRIRKFTSQVWDNREVEHIIRENVQHLLGRIKESEFDLIKDFSRPLPALTISRILGLPVEDHTYLKNLGTDMIKSLDLYITLRDIRKINEASVEFLSYFKKLILEKKENEDTGLISKLIRTNDEKGTLTEPELISTCILLFIAGEETSLGLTGTGLMNLVDHQAVIETLRNQAELIPMAVEELIRYDAPVQIAGRIAGEDTELHGRQIRKGETLTLCIGSANRDEEIFEKPDEMIITREPNRHLGFGAGAHFCLGDWLAKVQTKIAIELMLDHFKKIELMEPELRWNDNLPIRSLVELPVRVAKA